MNKIQQRKQLLLDALYVPYKKCTQCPLGFLGRKNVVFGAGNANAQLMLIGEAPGEQEDEAGRPFVGRSGKLLNSVLEDIGIYRSDIFITNIVKCRPPNNRKPFANERKTCKTILLSKQIEIIKPKIICTLGTSASEGLLEQSVKITRIRGTIVKHQGKIIIPTFHPAYILRNPKMLKVLKADIAFAHSLIKKQK